MARLIATAETLTAWLDPVAALVDECKLHLDADEARIMAVDPANVAMVDSRLAADGADAYDVGGETIGVNLDRLMDVLGFADSSDLVFVSLDTQTRKLSVEIGSHAFELATINPQTVRDEPDLPDLDLPTSVTLPGEDIEDAIDVADLVGDHVTIGSDSDQLTFVSEGDTDSGTTTYDADDCLDADIGEASSLYSLDYLTDITSPMDSDAEVRLEVGTEYPLEWHYAAAEGHVDVTYLVCPRIQTGGGA